ncbi:MAG: TlpA family protein disulfide reductase [Gemmatimonadota bacterium]
MRADAGVRIAALACAILLGACASPEGGLRTAPDFTLPKLTGPDSLSLAELDGQYVLMNFWASWCGPCRQEMPGLVRIHRRYRGTGLTVLGVTVNDRPEDSRGFAREYGLEFPNVIGNEQLYEDYGLSPWIPVTMLIGRDGRILEEWLGPQSEATFLQAIVDVAPELEGAAAGGLRPTTRAH